MDKQSHRPPPPKTTASYIVPKQAFVCRRSYNCLLMAYAETGA
jgi:hypothetical protein